MEEPRASAGSPEGVCIVGGGVIGLASAAALSGAGAEVTVVDPGRTDLRAAWAAGGMLAPLAEAAGPGPFLEMARESLHLYPRFVADLAARTRLRLGLHLNGKLLTAYRPESEARLRARVAALRETGGELSWMDGAAVRRLEPALSPEVRGAVFLEGQGRVDNRTLCLALERDCHRRGVDFVEDRVAEVIVGHGRVRGVRLEGGVTEVPCSAVVIAAGAWSAGIRGLPRALPVRPVKGQMLALAAPDLPLTRVVTAGDRYLIPRDTSSGPVVVVGATEEDAGFDLETDEVGQSSLHEAAVRLVPSLRDARVVERWAGLRPGTPEGLPILGPDPEVPDLCYATGHHRNGILLAPLTAARVLDWWRDRG
jgi:glycine oxidase